MSATKYLDLVVNQTHDNLGLTNMSDPNNLLSFKIIYLIIDDLLQYKY